MECYWIGQRAGRTQFGHAMKLLQSESKGDRWLISFLLLVPPLVLAVFMPRYRVDVIDWDEWQVGTF